MNTLTPIINTSTHQHPNTLIGMKGGTGYGVGKKVYGKGDRVDKGIRGGAGSGDAIGIGSQSH